jgi:class 3 adenylate cyclase
VVWRGLDNHETCGALRSGLRLVNLAMLREQGCRRWARWAAKMRRCGPVVQRSRSCNDDGPDLEIKHGLRPHLRIGLNTGAAVVGKVQGGADARATVLGDTVNFAARLQALADPDCVLMSEATHRSVQGMVEARFAGEHSIKGKSEAQKVYRLDGIRHATRVRDSSEPWSQHLRRA